jgi:hypothetical protein
MLFLLPAAINGFPFVYSDTGVYLGMSGIRHFSGRPASYAIFNRLVDLRLSPWPSAILQSLVTSWTIWRFASSLFHVTGPLRLLSLAVALTFGTSLPWFVGWIMPDIFDYCPCLALLRP